jgi:polyribonucleotide nucleotidyltransferase
MRQSVGRSGGNGSYSFGVSIVVWLLLLLTWTGAIGQLTQAFSIGASSGQYGNRQAYYTRTMTALSDSVETAALTESSSSTMNDAPATPSSTTATPPPPLFTVESSPTGPADGLVHTLTFWSIPGQEDSVPPTVLKVGRMGRLAAGAVELQRGDTVLYATAAYEDEVKDNDFVPLSVEHTERFSSAGLTSGSFTKRDGRPGEHEILTCRLIDRPLRPLIASGWRHETQLLSWVLSFDGERSCDPLAIVASAAALYLSSVPLTKPVAAVLVGMAADGTFLVNPTLEQMQASRLHLIIAGTADAVLMIEGEADFLPESTFIEAVRFGHAAVVAFCQGIYAFGEAIGIEKDFSTIKPPIEGLQERVNQVMTEQVDAMYAVEGNKQAKGVYMGALYTDVLVALQDEFPNETVAIHAALKKLLCQRMFARAQQQGLRGDGRRMNEIRRLDMQVGLLPRVHGSALFTRGETQALATATLGDSGMRQKIDTIAGLQEKRFYLQYTFPPSCVGETGRVGMPGRREVGHGNLAERALLQTLPSHEEFPYSIRVESLITESHGSSSMASVCGGCLALMDAGVPIKRTVAGIAMGMLLGDKDGISDENAIVLSDITGTEDALGTMDFKVAGDREGITTFQLDIKCEGLTLETMARALEQAREGRLHLLDAMEQCLDAPRPNLPATVPKMKTFTIAADSIGKVIGPGGKQIRAIIEDFSLANMDIGEEGGVQLSGFDTEQLEKAEEFVKALVSGAGGGGANGRRERTERAQYAGPEPVVGENYTGKVKGIHPFGVFVEFLPGAEDGSTPGFEGLVHVSELARDRVRNCEGFMKSMGVEEVTVKYLGMDKGKARLSRKAVLEEQLGRLNPNGAIGSNPTSEPTEQAMSTVDATVIAQALEGLQDL